MTDASEIVPTPDAHVLIVGGGTSGLTCSLFLARAGVTSTIFDQNRSILKRAWLHNYPGVDSVIGTNWLTNAHGAIDKVGHATFVEGRVAAVGVAENGHYVDGPDGRVDGDYLVIASGQTPTPFIEGLGLETADPVQPYVLTNIVVDRWGASSVEGVYACGVVAGHPSQAVICAGSGANVAVRIVSLLRGEFWVDHDEVES